jgi:hypothetical protein
MERVGHVACMKNKKCITYKILVGKRNERHHMGDLDLDSRIILKRILNKYVLRGSAGFI